MTTKQPPPKKDGKPTIDQENHQANVGQREQTATVNAPSEKGTSEKETISPDRHGNDGERSWILSDPGEVE